MILVGIPCSDTVKTRFAYSLFNLKGDYHISMQIGCDVAHNRNKIVTQLLDKDYTHVLFVDSDMQFEPDTLQRMLEHDKDILGLAANRRKLPLESVVKPLDGDITKPLPKELFEAESCGTGMMLIKSGVFEYLPAPWFEFTYDEKGERVGEDVEFCRKARMAGYDIHVDPTIPIKHLGEYGY